MIERPQLMRDKLVAHRVFSKRSVKYPVNLLVIFRLNFGKK